MVPVTAVPSTKARLPSSICAAVAGLVVSAVSTTVSLPEIPKIVAPARMLALFRSESTVDRLNASYKPAACSTDSESGSRVAKAPITSLPPTHAVLPDRMSPAAASPELVSTTLESPGTPKIVAPDRILPSLRSVSTSERSKAP